MGGEETTIDVKEPLITGGGSAQPAAEAPAAEAPAAGSNPNRNSSNTAEKIGFYANAVYGSLSVLGFAALCGFAAGYLLSRKWWVLMIVVLVIFVIIQLLAWFGIISLNMADIKERGAKCCKCQGDEGCCAALKPILTKIAANGFPAAVGFIVGFVIGDAI